ncbi:DEAD/DEAH box helicase [Mesorhizobium sp. P16.1]|uniref:DEAD/DEAH box helicase n=1 Tax=unclassified Mesorhizobium TaxID=325217 RepID=UPI0021A4CC85|nr:MULTISPECIES: DEAD/DEAH box helicase [unclassified Mesorhizobium]MCT2580890.1 DEAD/DEAH box helicase [Mesorhizobium sp. P13.3]MDF3169971.1 DEAD/DEAH box helicase [Mesorhizobium sp. P16.1]MDF3181301.1 DEAD/DEAH box helicase [Mesorhizobium sp. P17.1]MDF3186850.1 DEAD/DEAH box helicase [Mesorhizobium sp. ICCV3110.1]
MTAAFDALHPALRYHIVSTLGWPDLRPTQAEAVAPLIAGEDVLLLAPTAGGKTEAAAFPLLSRIALQGWRGLSALYVCPLKALLNNLAPRLSLYAEFLGMRIGVWHGDVGEPARRRILRDPPEILLTTPESLEAMMISARLDHAHLLQGIQSVVVDELHAFAGDDRGWHLMFLLARLERLTGRHLQRIGLTATVGNPNEILDWFSMGRGGHVIGPRSPQPGGDVTVDQIGSVSNAISAIARLYGGERRLVFADSRTRVEEIAAGLRNGGVRTFVSHASLSLDQRRQAEIAFAQEPDCVIVATSTLELGLDVGDLDRVIQIGSPPSVASFLQRMGRTGRRSGTSRNCLFLATNDEELLRCMALSTLFREGKIEPVVPPALPAHLFAQQIMALSLQLGGISRPDINAWLGDVVDAVPEAKRAAILEHMLGEGILDEDAGVIGLGAKGEREFGRRHFSDLVAAFSEPLLLSVRYGPADLGTVHPASLGTRRAGDPAVLSLGGRSWKVVDIDWRRRVISVVPSDSGGRSRWLGSGRAMSQAVCMTMERIVAGTEPACQLSRRAQSALAQIRDRLAFVDGDSLPVVSDGNGRIVIWAFAGGAASASIAAGVAAQDLSVIEFNDLSISLQTGDLDHVARALRSIDPVSVSPKLPEDLGTSLKFGLCLPAEVIASVLKARTADEAAVTATCRRKLRLIYAGENLAL